MSKNTQADKAIRINITDNNGRIEMSLATNPNKKVSVSSPEYSYHFFLNSNASTATDMDNAYSFVGARRDEGRKNSAHQMFWTQLSRLIKTQGDYNKIIIIPDQGDDQYELSKENVEAMVAHASHGQRSSLGYRIPEVMLYMGLASLGTGLALAMVGNSVAIPAAALAIGGAVVIFFSMAALMFKHTSFSESPKARVISQGSTGSLFCKNDKEVSENSKDDISYNSGNT